MTIQSLMSNKGSLILASDLAVTMDDYKSYIGVKKVFEIKKDIPVGIMINGLIDFEEIPLETLIGEFFENIDDLNSVKNIEEEFVKFLSKHTNYTPIEDYIKEVLKSFKERLCETIEEDGFENTIKNKTSRNIQEFLRNYSNFENEFYDLIPPGFDKREYNLKIWKIFSFELTFEGTGIIIAGFDKNHHYPSIISLNIYCNDNGKIIWEEIECKINCKDPLIRIYAMNEEAYSFITGVSDEFEFHIKNYTNSAKVNILQNMEWYLKNKEIKEYDKILKVLKNELNGYYEELNEHIDNFKSKIIEDTYNSCEYLPRRLLCNFADYLIKLTALKQQLSLDLETVSSESDVLLLTKTNKPKWIKYTDEII